jgi:hypothetical protein
LVYSLSLMIKKNKCNINKQQKTGLDLVHNLPIVDIHYAFTILCKFKVVFREYGWYRKHFIFKMKIRIF